MSPSSSDFLRRAWPALAALAGWFMVTVMGTWPLRLAAMLAVGFAAFQIRRPERRGLALSPLFLLALQSLLFYSLLPAALTPVASLFQTPQMVALFATALNERAEALVLIFALLCAGFAPRLPAPVLSVQPLLSVPALRTVAALAALAALVLLGLTLAGRYEATISFGRGGYWQSQVMDAIAPLTGFALAMLHVHWLKQPRRHGAFLLAFALFAAVAIMAGRGKFIFFLGGGMVLSWLALSPLRGRFKLPVLLVGPLALVVGLTAFNLVRDHGAFSRGLAPKQLAENLSAKLVLRQIQTDFCLKSVMDEHWADNRPAHALDFLTMFVPRPLWPDKPSFSNGNAYGVRYCAVSPVWVTHSASLTMLGEPIVQAGAVGWAVGQVAVLAALAGFALWTARLGAMGVAVQIAMIPWLVDFDQSLAMYLGNAVKALLVGLPLLALAWWIKSKEARRCAE